MKGQNFKGFTLIELMIVIAVISILASIIIPNISRARARAQLAACIENLKAINQAVHMYQVDNSGNVPETSGHKKEVTQADLPELIPDYINQPRGCPTNLAPYAYWGQKESDGMQTWCQGDHYPIIEAGGSFQNSVYFRPTIGFFYWDANSPDLITRL